MVEKIKSSNQISEVLYLPLKYYYKQTGLCGSGGTIHVLLPHLDHLRSVGKLSQGRDSESKKESALLH